jgi:hypothetical protein
MTGSGRSSGIAAPSNPLLISITLMQDSSGVDIQNDKQVDHADQDDRVASSARRGFTRRSMYGASGFRRKRCSAD